MQSMHHNQYICQKKGYANLLPKDNQHSGPGHKYLQSLCDKPEFVCTCCHHWLFWKSVCIFNKTKFDFTKNTVKKTLSDDYQYPMHVPLLKGLKSPHVQGNHDYDDSSDSDSDDILPSTVCDGPYNPYTWPTYDRDTDVLPTNNVIFQTFEYICKTCQASLFCKTPQTPAQACANGLDLPPVPEQSLNLTDLEQTLVSLHIPFMKMLHVHRYGEQYKLNGPCVNVSTSLDHIIHILPRMSDEVQLHTMKLRRKLIYKTNYLYHFIRKDIIMSAIRWLKQIILCTGIYLSTLSGR